MAIQYAHNDSTVLRIIPKDRTTLIISNTNNELVKKSLMSGKKKCKTIGQSKPLSKHYKVYNTEKTAFIVDSDCIFVTYGEYLITGQHMENNFLIYRLSSFELFAAIPFHKVRVSVKYRR